MEIWERPPSMLKNVDGEHLGGGVGGPRAPTINAKNIDGGPPWEAVMEMRERPPSMLRNVNCGPPGRQ
jgi:hypothetical protein